jgi:TolB-like protein/tRNA A-37 threonylcarbamoyl transferase component Bud32
MSGGDARRGRLRLVEPGDALAGAPPIPGYRLLREIGRGGMATVYVAVQESLGREVALKVLDASLARDPSFEQRFLREGRIAANLHHRHIVAVHDLGVAGGRPYLAMDYLPRGSVAALAGAMAPAEALRCAKEIASALDLAHRHGIVHRDVKPENILRHEDGAYVLSDFGIARDVNASTVTQDGVAVGTPQYMSPEQWRNQAIDGRSDLYALGVVLYQLLTGRVPYAGSDGWTIGMQHMSAPVPRLPDAYRPLQPLVDRLLAKDAKRRVATGAAVANAIDALVASRGLPIAVPAGTPDAVPAWSLRDVARMFRTRSQRERARWAEAVAAAVFAVAVLLLQLGGSEDRPQRAGTAARSTPVTAALAAGGIATLGAIAVLPCINHTTDPNLAWYGDGLAEELILRLSRLKALPVIGRTSSFAFRDAQLTAHAIGDRLGAEHVLSCTIRETGGGLQIGAELIATATQTQRWSGVYEKRVDAALDAVDDIAVGIAEQLLANLVGTERALLLRHNTDSMEALELYRRALLRSDDWTPEALVEARALAERALEIDPGFALAHIALVQVLEHELQVNHVAPESIRAPILAHLDAAEALVPELPDALVWRGLVAAGFDADYRRARELARRAYLLQPNSSSVVAALASLESNMFDRNQGVALARRLQELEPANPHLQNYLAWAHYHARRFDEAERESARLLARFPSHWVLHWLRAHIELAQRDCAAAIRSAEAARTESQGNVETYAILGYAYACGGRPADAEALLTELLQRRAAGENVPAGWDAMIEFGLGHVDRAFAALERAVARREYADVVMTIPPVMDGLRGDPRFGALVKRYGAPPELFSAIPRELRGPWSETNPD